MALYLELIPKEPEKAPPERFQDIDAKMCKHFDVECHEKHWYYEWYNLFGLPLAAGKTFDYLREEHNGSLQHVNILTWLEENYTVHCYRGR